MAYSGEYESLRAYVSDEFKSQMEYENSDEYKSQMAYENSDEYKLLTEELKKLEEARIGEPCHVDEDGDPECLIIGDTHLDRTKVTADTFSDLNFIFNTSIVDPDNPVKTTYESLDSCSLLQYKLLKHEKKLELPRRLPPNHDISDNFVLVFEQAVTSYTMVFLIDWSEQTGNVSLYHVFTQRFPRKYYRSTGYATSGERLYIVGGKFVDHNNPFVVDDIFERLIKEHDTPFVFEEHYFSVYERAVEEARNTPTKCLEVPTYNLRAREWEKDPPCLKAPKPNPVVFLYNGKIFALRGRYDYHIRETSPSCEYLDTNACKPCWTELPPPPFDMENYYYHFFDQERGVLFLFFTFRFRDIGDDPTLPCCELHLNTEPYKWRHNAKVSDSAAEVDPVPSPDLINPDSDVCSRIRHITPELFKTGCIVDGILFSYETGNIPRKPSILAHRVYRDETSQENFDIQGVEDYLNKEMDTASTSGILHHIRDYRFCLIIDYDTGCTRMTDAVYFVIFDLVKKKFPDEARKIKSPCSQKGQRVNNYYFKFEPVCGRAFQLPSSFSIRFSRKLPNSKKAKTSATLDDVSPKRLSASSSKSKGGSSRSGKKAKNGKAETKSKDVTSKSGAVFEYESGSKSKAHSQSGSKTKPHTKLSAKSVNVAPKSSGKETPKSKSKDDTPKISSKSKDDTPKSGKSKDDTLKTTGRSKEDTPKTAVKGKT